MTRELFNDQSSSGESWREYLRLRPRFQRSVHIERDADNEKWLDGYVLTPLVRQTTERIAAGIVLDEGARAWSLTGPYGSGKSAFALFLTRLLGLPENDRGARRRLEKEDGRLAQVLFGEGALDETGLLPAVAVGERRPLDQIVLDALREACRRFWPKRRPDAVKRIDELAERAQKGQVPPREIVTVLEELATKVVESKRGGCGILLLIDEGGKPLEFAAQSPMRGDVQLLQEIAEAANRTTSKGQILFIVTLHQALESYASGLSASQRNEWAKVHGRFEDVPFREHNEQVLRLIGQAIDFDRTKKRVRDISKLADAVASGVGLRVQEGRAGDLLEQCAPLNPVAALVLGPLFRSQIGQNERSLFAFLASNEPHGFLDFANRRFENLPLYTVDRLYDYVRAALGARLYGHGGRHWSMIEEALQRLPEDADPLDARVIKALGVLAGLRESAGLSPTSKLIAHALVETPTERVKVEAAVRQSLDRLRDARIVIHQRFRGSYQLWDGSDLDLDVRLQEAIAETRNSVNLARRVRRLIEPRPLMARRHFFETGTLRYFGVYFKDYSALAGELVPEANDADGEIWLLLPGSTNEADRAAKVLTRPDTWFASDGNRPLLVVLPENIEAIQTYGRELVALEWIERNTPELQGDAVARRELNSRLTEVKGLLRREIQDVLAGHGQSRWFNGQNQHDVKSGADVTRVLSHACDEAYSQAPKVFNELLNRTQLSSAAAAARRNLCEAMAERAHLERLGIEGSPPELSMYRSLLEAHRLHVCRDDTWTLSLRTKAKLGTVGHALIELDRYLMERPEALIELEELYAFFGRPPYGIKAGLMPVLLLALVIAKEGEIALYEDGAFVPKVDGAVIERLLRARKTFCVQRTPLTGARKKVLDAYREALGLSGPPSVLGNVRGLVSIAGRLPLFTQNTRTLTATTRELREILLRAKQPSKLLYRDIPNALGREAFDAQKVPNETLEDFKIALTVALDELRSAYPKMLDRFSSELFAAFGYSNTEEARLDLAARAHDLKGYATSTSLQALLVRISNSEAPAADWVNSIATLVGKKPPASWYDRDLDAAKTAIRLAAKEFHGLQDLADARNAYPGARDSLHLIRLLVQETGQSETTHVAAFAPEELQRIEMLVQSIETALKEQPDEDLRLSIGALALAALRRLNDQSTTEEALAADPQKDQRKHG